MQHIETLQFPGRPGLGHRLPRPGRGPLPSVPHDLLDGGQDGDDAGKGKEGLPLTAGQVQAGHCQGT